MIEEMMTSEIEYVKHGAIARLRKFLNAAGAEGFVLDGVDGGDLFMEIFNFEDKIDHRFALAALAASTASDKQEAKPPVAYHSFEECANSVWDELGNAPLATPSDKQESVTKDARQRFIDRDPVQVSERTRELARQALATRDNDTRTDEEIAEAGAAFICDTRFDAPVIAATPAPSVADAPRRFTGEQIAALRVAADALVERYAEPIRAILRDAEVADAAGASERDSRIATVTKDLIECLMLWNGQASAGLDVNALAGLRDELNAIAKESGND
jgi:predicted transcriptional regulator